MGWVIGKSSSSSSTHCMAVGPFSIARLSAFRARVEGPVTFIFFSHNSILGQVINCYN